MFEPIQTTALRWIETEGPVDPGRYLYADYVLPGEPVPGDWEVPGLLEALVDGDPAAWPAPAVGCAHAQRAVPEVLADGERAPMSPSLVAELSGLDPAVLTDAERVSLTVGLARAESHVAARKLAAVASFVRREPANRDDPAAFAWAEIAAAQRLGDAAATSLVHLARRLAHSLPGTREALQRGDITLAKARTLVEATERLTDTERAAVESRVLPKAATRTPAQHGAAVRRAVETVAPESPDDRRERQARDLRLVATHLGSGMGQLFAGMRSEDLETTWLGADTWARRAKADGDPRSLDELRVAALTRWAESFLTHGDPTHCDTSCAPATTPSLQNDGPADTDGDHATTPSFQNDAPGIGAPRRHGRPVTVNVTVDLPTLLSLADNAGELLGTGALLPADTLRGLLTEAAVRVMVIDRETGRLLHLGSRSYRPGAELAAFIAMRDVTATTPTGAQASAAAQDLDHITPHDQGGPTDPDNLHSPTRRWHRAKTLAGWKVHANPDGSWTWTSPTGREYRVEPHDYRN